MIVRLRSIYKRMKFIDSRQESISWIYGFIFDFNIHIADGQNEEIMTYNSTFK